MKKKEISIPENLIDRVKILDCTKEISQLEAIKKTIQGKYESVRSKNLYDAEVRIDNVILSLKTL
jgi:hypothetical protein